MGRATDGPRDGRAGAGLHHRAKGVGVTGWGR